MSKDAQQLINDFLEKEYLYLQFGESMNSLLVRLVEISNINTHSIHFRIKDRKSLKSKIETKNKYENLRDITDILGVRIITYYSNDIEEIEKIIRKNFIIDEINTIDKRKIHEPDRFGYMSLHYVVSLNSSRAELIEYSDFKDLKFEIQIRTILHHTWAEIEHDLGYKTQNSVPNHIRRKFSILSGTLELIDGAFIDIKNSLTEYEKAIEREISEDSSSIAEVSDDENDINSLYVKGFVLGSSDFDNFYGKYLDGETGDMPKTLSSSFLYPNGSINEKQVSYDILVDFLKKIGVRKKSDLSNYIKILDKDDKIIKTILSFRPGYDEKYLSKYFMLLFATYCYAAKEDLSDKFEGFGGQNFIKKLGEVYNSI